MEKYKIIIGGKAYQTEAASKEEAEKIIKEKLSKKNPKTKTKKEEDKKSFTTNMTNNYETIIDYAVVETENSHSLENRVKSYIQDRKKGEWRPVGGICITPYAGKGLIGQNERYTYSQALALYYKKK
jgi:hypothetical protein